MKACVTGHRPMKLFRSAPYSAENFHKLTVFAQEVLSWATKNLELTEVITGMALGWDQAIAKAAFQLEIPFTAATPFEGQENYWPLPTQAMYHDLLKNAKEVVVVTKPKPVSTKLVIKALQDRNAWMIDNSELVMALWDGSSGGTHNAIQYATKKDRKVLNFWDSWDKRR